MGYRLSASRASRGFTLIELMIVVAVIGILSAIAYPSYTSYVLRGHRAEAQSYLMDLAQRQQQYFTDNRAYATNETLLNAPVPSSLSSRYTFTFEIEPRSFKITAAARDSKLADGDLSINEAGVKTPSDKW